MSHHFSVLMVRIGNTDSIHPDVKEHSLERKVSKAQEQGRSGMGHLQLDIGQGWVIFSWMYVRDGSSSAGHRSGMGHLQLDIGQGWVIFSWT